MKSYKHYRFNYTAIEDNKWINHMQYYRSLWYANAIYLPSLISYKNFYGNTSNKNNFKAKFLAGIIGKFIFYLFKKNIVELMK